MKIEEIIDRVQPGAADLTNIEKVAMVRALRVLEARDKEWRSRVQTLQESISGMRTPTPTSPGGCPVNLAHLTKAQTGFIAELCDYWLKASGLQDHGMPGDYDDDLDGTSDDTLRKSPDTFGGKVALARKLGKWVKGTL